MNIRRMAAPVALLASGALVLSACTASEDPETPNTSSSTSTGGTGGVEPTDTGKADLGEVVTADDTIYYTLGGEEWLGYNGNTPETYSTYQSVVNDRMFSGFMYFGTDGAIYQDEEYGTFEVTSEDPMVVEYTLNDAAAWSDGEPIKYEDYLLEWAARSIADGKNEDGTPKPLFNHVSGTDMAELVPAGPKGEAGAKTFSYEYSAPNPDYALQITSAFPAHIVAQEAGMSLEELVTAIQEKDVEALRPAAEFWNTGWLSPTPGELPDPALTPVSGPYKLSAWQAGQSVTLVANEAYWGTPPATKTLVYRFVAPEAQVQALENGDLDVIEPQATVDTVKQIEGLGDAVSLLTGESLTWEHLDFNFNAGVFADSLELREAFAMCVPRQQIVDNLVKPIDPNASVMNAREVFPFQENYDEVVSAAYDGRYDEVKLEDAKAKIAASGIETPIKVRIGYSAPNQRRTEEVALIKSSCDQAGFEIEDVGNKDFFAPGGTLESGDYEVALFAWAGSGQITSGENIYATGRPQNYGGFSSETVDEAWKTLISTLDESVHLEQTKIIEKALWDELYGIPVFAHPGVVAYDSKIQNVRDTAAQSTVAWNAEQWVRAS